jgi:lipopolysaccharide export system protein LptA
MRSPAVVPFLLACAALPALAQGTARASQAAKECVVITTGVVRNGELTSTLTMHGRGDSTWMGGGVDAKCEGTDQRVLSDSAEQYADRHVMILIGHVHYTESRLKLDADRITYFTAEERLLAEGNVVGVTNTGTRFTGPRAEYLRPAAGVREKSHLVAEPRSNIWVSPKDAGNDSKDSVNVQADRLIMDNDSLIFARGVVVIERPDLLSTSDSAFVDKFTEFARLTQTPRVVGRGDRHFTLSGNILDIFSKKHEVERVKSLGDAVATSDDVTLKADTIDLRIVNQKLDRAFAWGRSRSHAHSKEQDITADSIDVLMPGQTLRTMRAVGRAIAESDPDSTKIASKKLDYLQGDTIIARFDSLAATDTASQPSIKEVFAKGTPTARARSYYQVARNSEGKTDQPNVNYVLGDSITVTFRKRQVYEVHVLGHVEGFYDELAADSTHVKAAKDSATTRPAPKPAEKKKP